MGIGIIIPAQWEQAAQPRPKGMNAAAFFGIEEGTGTIRSIFHTEIGKDHTLLGMQSQNLILQELFKRLMQAGREHENIIGIQVDRVGHAVAAVPAAIAFCTVYFCHLGRSIFSNVWICRRHGKPFIYDRSMHFESSRGIYC